MQTAHNIKELDQVVSTEEMRLFEKKEFLKKKILFFYEKCRQTGI